MTYDLSRRTSGTRWIPTALLAVFLAECLAHLIYGDASHDERGYLLASRLVYQEWDTNLYIFLPTQH